MPSNSDKWIRSIKDNPAGKVVSDPEGNRWNRWEWQSDDPTSHQLKKLNNDELAIENADLQPTVERPGRKTTPRAEAMKSAKPGARDAGGGFNPYDHSGRPKRR